MRLALHHRILIGLVVGSVLGLLANALFPDGPAHDRLAWFSANITEPIGQIFIRLIFMIALPLVFTALVLGVAEMGDLRKLGRVGMRTLVMTVVLSSISVAIGISLASALRPGGGLPPEKRAALIERFQQKSADILDKAKKAKSVRQILLDVIPTNPLQEMVGSMDGSSPGGGMLAVMFFALIFGIALTMTPDRTGPLIGVIQGVYDVVMTIIGYAMRLAPIGVAALLFSVTSLLGFDILKTLLLFMLTALVGLALHCIVVYSIVVATVARISPRVFFSRIREALLTAFATSSSSATLPTALRVTEQELGIRPDVTRFVLTVGSTANQNGTALYEGIVVLFLAQVFGVDLTLPQQVVVVLMSILAGIGTAGIPGGSLPLIAVVLTSVGVPGEGIAIILGVDRLIDMCRTVVNVAGDIAIAACVDRQESGRPSTIAAAEQSVSA